MNEPFDAPNNRVLVVDDNASIHADFERILAPPEQERQQNLDDLVSSIFGESKDDDADPPAAASPDNLAYELGHANQGQEAYELLKDAEDQGTPFALAFVDMRMPPGWDGLQTIKRFWQDFPHLEIVICTAYSDYSWDQMLEELGHSDKLQFLRKPFDVVSIKQMALALCRKWDLGRADRSRREQLEGQVEERTAELRHKVAELEQALGEIERLQGILPMCSYCHKVRDDNDYWEQVDEYIRKHTPARVSHGVCPECYEKVMKEQEEKERQAAKE